MDPEQQSSAPTLDHLASVKVFPLIPALKRDVTNTIDSALSWDQLTATDINFSVVRPVVNKYARLKNMAVVYACLVVRSYFLAQAESSLAFSGVMTSRANLCEILAIKLLSRFAKHYIKLVAVLTTTWSPLAGAASYIVDEVKQILNDDDVDNAQSAIEIAISTSAKTFLASPVTQRVVNDIYSGRVVFSVTANRSILADNYKPRAIEIYNPYRAPFLDHYRLRVPKYGAYLEFINFAFLFLTFVLCLSNRDKSQITPWEIAFIVFGSAFVLEEYTASTEHGWIIYIANMWNAFDFSFIVIFLAYLTLRIQGLSKGDLAASEMAFEVLACGACILFPRLAFFAVSNNMIILSLRAMISQFVFFIAVAAICFSGLLFTLWTLASDNAVGQYWTIKSIAWLMVQIWFGNTSLSFAQATSFHPFFGPILMTMFAALSNTLLLTILISILSNTVAVIDANATQEFLFQYTIGTIVGVKSDALFSYQPPFNILALLILKPASWFVTPRALHSANVFLIRLTSLPQLVIIGIYERHLRASNSHSYGTGPNHALHIGDQTHQKRQNSGSFFGSLPRQIKNMPLLEVLVGSTSHDLFDAIFDIHVEEGEYDIFDEEDEEDVGLTSVNSRESMRSRGEGFSTSGNGGEGRSTSRTSVPRIRTRRPTSLEPASNRASPKQRLSTLGPSVFSSSPTGEFMASPEIVTSPTLSSNNQSSNRSPLARLFTSRFSSSGFGPVSAIDNTGHTSSAMAHAVSQAVAAQAAAAQTESSMRQVTSLLEAVNQLPVQKLKEEMKELQDRQARIENLLLMLTRGMRGDTSGPTGQHRQGSVS